jgi:murein DD-endopeptidase MepM/ murein hydrolase activator NlpD
MHSKRVFLQKHSTNGINAERMSLARERQKHSAVYRRDRGIFTVKIILHIFILFSVVATNTADADIYRYISKDGVVSYTDAPVHKDSVLIIREHRRIGKKGLKINGTATNNVRNTHPAAQTLSLSAKTKSFALPVNGVITSTVGLRYDPIDGMLRNHNGVDIAIPDGTPIKPVAPGTILYSGIRGGYGNIVIVEHENGMTTLYAHNSLNLVASGDRVDTNSTIALSGSTGRSTGPHLHFEAWLEGQNITMEFLADPSSLQRYSPAKPIARKLSVIRKVEMADGAILLTNLPLTHP